VQDIDVLAADADKGAGFVLATVEFALFMQSKGKPAGICDGATQVCGMIEGKEDHASHLRAETGLRH
jgi:hypothetical protein